MTHILENGKIQKLMGMGYTHGLMGTGMKDSGTCVSNTERALTLLEMERLIQVSLTMENIMARGSTPGQMIAYIPVTL